MPKPRPMLTWTFLLSLQPCDDPGEGLDWAKTYFKGRSAVSVLPSLRRLITEHHEDWANWLIVRVMTRPQYLAYAIYAVKQVIGLYERKYPNDLRLRQAIEAARAVLAQDTPATRQAAGVAAGAAWAASEAAVAARAAGAVGAAWAAAEAAEAAGAAGAAGAAEAAARRRMQRKILRYGMRLLEGAGDG